MAPASSSMESVIFVDTSVLLRIRLFWDAASRYQLISPGHLERKKVLQEFNQFTKRLKEVLLYGYNALAYLQNRQRNGVRIYTSRLVRLEMLRAVLEGALHQQLARWGILWHPGRAGLAFGEPLQSYLPSDELRESVERILNFPNDLSARCGVQILFIEDYKDYFRDALEIAELITKEVILDNIMDSFIYASALAVQADQLITSDRAFSKMINKLCNPSGDRRWDHLQQSLRRILERYGQEQPVFPASPGLGSAGTLEILQIRSDSLTKP